MSEKTETKQTEGSSRKLGILFAVIGIILVIVGLAIIGIPNVLRGSGLGTISLVTGVVLLILAIVSFIRKRA